MKKQWKRLLALLMVLTMCVAVLPGAALADDDTKTLTVGSSQDADYTTIQGAINYINEQSDKTGWTITVEAGEYARFTVLNGMDNLTVQAAEGATVTIPTMNGSANPDKASSANPETDGVSIRYAQNVTLDGLTFTMGTTKTNWVAAAVSNYTEQSTKGDNFTVKNCTFQGSGTGYAVFVNAGTTKFTVTGCTFDNVYDGVEMYGDNTLMSGATVTYNTFTNCAFAMHGYYGGTGDAGTLEFAYNTVTGTSALRCKVVVQDQLNTGALKVDVHNNTFTYALVGLVNLQEEGETVSNVLSSNTFGNGSFYVDAVEPGSIEVTYASYQAPDDDEGYWLLTGIEDNTLISYNEAVDADVLQAIKDAIAVANATGSHTLDITSVDIDGDGEVDENELIRTFTWCKDAIYWVSGENDKTSYPGLEKKILVVDENGDTQEVDETSINAGDTVKFQLTSNVPQDLTNYLEPDEVENAGIMLTAYEDELHGGTYLLTFHDTMDDIFTFNDDVVVTIVTYNEDGEVAETKTLPSSLYTVSTNTNDGCTFEVTMDLVDIYDATDEDGEPYFTEDDFGTASIIVTYTATASESLTPGTYENTAWVEYEGNETEEDTVEVYTYGINIFKYDQSTGTEDADGNTTYTGLSGAKFELRRVVEIGEDVEVTENTDGEGNVSYSYTTTDEDGNETTNTVYKDGTDDDAYYYVVVATPTSGSDGYVKVEGLAEGTYYLIETQAPSGYVYSDAALQIVIPDDADAETYLVSVQFANAPIPGTGGTGTAMYTTVGVIILLAAGCVFLFTRKKRESD